MRLPLQLSRSLIAGALACLTMPVMAQSPVIVHVLYNQASNDVNGFAAGPVAHVGSQFWSGGLQRTMKQAAMTPQTALLVGGKEGNEGWTRGIEGDTPNHEPVNIHLSAIAQDGSKLIGNLAPTWLPDQAHAFCISDAQKGQYQMAPDAGDVSVVNASSLNGDVVVGGVGTGDQQRAFAWGCGSTGLDLIGSLGGRSQATAISRRGDYIAGEADGSTFSGHAFLFDSVNSKQIQDLGSPGNAAVRPVAVSDGGQVVAATYDAGTASQSVVYVKGLGWRNLGTLGGRYAVTVAMSRDGKTVMGYSAPATGFDHVFLFNQVMEDLGTLPGAQDFRPAAMSDDGKVVIGAVQVNQQPHAFYYSAATGLVDMNADLARTFANDGVVQSRFTALSADGHVVSGDFTDQQGVQHAFAILL
ncbi:hypothetical protein [Paludibacterium sp. B53371]|uniref:hypothetical protein n=1 Tax=Paludibacterium sp. B53371 TaxID=2806263 RepID=UPI001C05BB4A|nr:hypothetical protein [Paludibacterium sp. B53371]